MPKFFMLLLLLAAAAMASGAAYITFWDLPPPVHTVEKALPNEDLLH